ncbi:hypothetical protein GW764_02985 [Candidatus Parcubacteria bacterium]|nr:hypothetical protein [Candidatus Parcubacteria bacterium]
MSTYNDSDFQELKELVEENHKILKGLQRKAKWATVFTFVKWGIAVAIAIGLFTILQPIFENIVGAYDTLVDGLRELNQAREAVSGSVDISRLIEIFNQGEN